MAPMLAAAHAPHLLVRQVVDALAFKQDLAPGDPARRFEQADDGGARERLAAHRTRRPRPGSRRRDVERDVVERARVPRRVGNSTFRFATESKQKGS
jgi:hypothetical protein